MDRLQEALNYLNSQIHHGVEFPDACYYAALQFHVDHDELRRAYDADQIAQWENNRGEPA